MAQNRYIVIMAGGSSGRFWPIARENKPKQFLCVDGSGKSFLRKAYERCRELVPEENLIIITLERFSGIVKEQIPEISDANLLLEPYGRKTGPCIAYSTYMVLKRDPSAVVAMIPSDLRIDDDDMFRDVITRAMDYASSNEVLMTLGITPERPDTNYGYIQVVGGRQAAQLGKPVKVKTFTEKPDREIAELFCRSGEFFWNSGIFVWQASVIRQEMEKYIPEITRLFSGWQGALCSSAEQTFISRAYSDCAKVSIDTGVMEKTDKAWLFPAHFGWADFDNWSSYYDNFGAYDEHSNAVKCDARLVENSRGTIMVSSNEGKLIAIKGLKDYIVVDTPDVLMICPRDDEQYKTLLAKTALPGFDKYR